MLPLLSDDLLLDAYRSSVRMGLDPDFVRLLRSEIRRRGIKLPEGQDL